MRRWLWTGRLLLSLSLGLAAFCITAIVSVAMVPTSSAPDGALPTLTPAQQQASQRIALASPRVAALLQGHPYTIDNVGVWTERSGSLLGGVVTISYTSVVPVLKGRWLGLDYDCSETHTVPYGRRPYRQTYRQVYGLIVWVDLVRHRVAGMTPIVPNDPFARRLGVHSSLGNVDNRSRQQYYDLTCQD